MDEEIKIEVSEYRLTLGDVHIHAKVRKNGKLDIIPGTRRRTGNTFLFNCSTPEMVAKVGALITKASSLQKIEVLEK